MDLATEFVPAEVWKAEIRALTKENSENKLAEGKEGEVDKCSTINDR